MNVPGVNGAKRDLAVEELLKMNREVSNLILATDLELKDAMSGRAKARQERRHLESFRLTFRASALRSRIRELGIIFDRLVVLISKTEVLPTNDIESDYRVMRLMLSSQTGYSYGNLPRRIRKRLDTAYGYVLSS